MRPLFDNDTIQIEITNRCTFRCSNCTRFCGHFEKPYIMDFDYFRKAVDSMVGFNKMVGIMGGEPLLHPEFEKFCEYARSLFPREQLGLWSAFPKGKEHYREIICKTFGNIFLNDHTRPDIFHQPLLVSPASVMSDLKPMYYFIDKCWIQNSWSASINPNGAFFCEVAAAWSLLLGETPETSKAWPVESGWWWRTTKDYTEQVETYCHRCGAAMPLKRRPSTDITDDISQDNYDLLKDRSPKLKDGEYKIHDGVTIPFDKQQRMASYKDHFWRNRIAAKYNIFIQPNGKGFEEPFLVKEEIKRPPELFKKMVSEYKESTICQE